MTNLRIPGPTPLPPSVLAAMQAPMIPHRGPEAKELFAELRAALARLHRTAGEVLIFPGSGTGALEASIVNLFSPGDRVLAIVGGAFGERYAKIARAFGLDVVALPVEWGRAADPAAVRDALVANPGVRGVLLTHNETSTGVTNDLQAIAAAVRERDALLLCDAVSSAGALPLEMDAWGVDIVLSGTQKAWMCPPGAAIVALGERAWEAHARATLPRFFWDFTQARDAARAGSVHVTPPLTTLYALRAALRDIEAEGLENVWARHAALGEYVRGRVAGLGLPLFADPAHASNSVTTAAVPEGIEAKALLDRLRERYDVVIAGGQGKLAGRIIRIGHLGYVHEPELAAALDALGAALGDLGYAAPAGARPAAAAR